ncbi:MAG: DUF4097 family beta strand repeat-containing protein [Terracoccus sp.]
MEKHFETTGPIRLKVELQTGDVTLAASDGVVTSVRLVPHGRGAEELAERFTVELRGDEVVVIAPKGRDGFFGLGTRGAVDVEVRLPEGSDADVKTGSGDVSASCLLAVVRAATGSGDLAFHEVGSGDLKSGSGDVSLTASGGDLTVRTGSGDVSVGSVAGVADLVSGSGDISVRRAERRLKVKTGSGDVRVLASGDDVDLMTGTGDCELAGVSGGEIRARTGTGDVVVAVASGVAAYLDLNTVTGDVRVELDDADDPGDSESTTRLSVQSGSGDIRVKRAQGSLA